MDKKKGSIWHRYKVWARAVHIDQIRGKDYKHQQMNPHTCSNCELEFMGEYCPRCGQHIGTARITLKNIVQNFFKEFFDLEDGFLFTMKELFYRPGYMMRDYLQGKRAHYFKPFQLLFVLGAIFIIAVRIIDPGTSSSRNTVNYYTLSEDIQTLHDLALTEEAKHYIDLVQAYADSAVDVERIAMTDSLRTTGSIRQFGLSDHMLTWLNTMEITSPEQQAWADSLKEVYLEAAMRANQASRTMRQEYLGEGTILGSIAGVVNNWVSDNSAFSGFLLLPVFLICVWLGFHFTKEGRKLNLAEYIIVFVYVNCQLVVLTLLRLFCTGSLVVANSPVFTWLMVLPIAIWDYKQLFKLTWWQSTWRSVVFIMGGTLLILRLMLSASRWIQINWVMAFS